MNGELERKKLMCRIDIRTKLIFQNIELRNDASVHIVCKFLINFCSLFVYSFVDG